MAQCAGRDGAQSQPHEAEPDLRLVQAQGARCEQDLHHDRSMVRHLPQAHRDRHRHQQRRAADKVQACAQVAPEMRVLGGDQPLLHLDATQDEHRTQQHQRVEQQGHGCPRDLDQRAGETGARDVGARAGERAARMRLDQAPARHDLGQHNLRSRARDDIDAAHDEAHGVHPRHRQPAQNPGQRYRGHDQRQRSLAGDIDRQLAYAVEPDTAGQAEQHEGRDFHRHQQAHLRRRGLQQEHGGQRQGEHGDLPAQRTDQDRGPQTPVDGIAEQVVGRQRHALPEGAGQSRGVAADHGNLVDWG